MNQRGMAGIVLRGAIHVIELYRSVVSPLRPPSCRFSPTCSQYAVEALNEFGLVRGSWLSSVRLAKCGPWHRGGWDPIPDRRESQRRPRADAGAAGHCATLRSDSVV